MNDPREAYIEAIWPRYTVEDIGKTLVRGREGIYLSRDTFNRSSDLSEAIKLRAVSVRWIRRCRVIKPPPRHPPPPANRKLRRPSPPSRQNMEVDIASKVVSLLKEQLDERDAKMEEMILRVLARVGTRTVDLDSIREVVQQMIRTDGSSSRPEPVQSDGGVRKSDDPVYIPSRIIDGKTKSSIDVKESTSEAGQVDDAAKKLGMIRRQKRDQQGQNK